MKLLFIINCIILVWMRASVLYHYVLFFHLLEGLLEGHVSKYRMSMSRLCCSNFSFFLKYSCLTCVFNTFKHEYGMTLQIHWKQKMNFRRLHILISNTHPSLSIYIWLFLLFNIYFLKFLGFRWLAHGIHLHVQGTHCLNVIFILLWTVLLVFFPLFYLFRTWEIVKWPNRYLLNCVVLLLFFC